MIHSATKTMKTKPSSDQYESLLQPGPKRGLGLKWEYYGCFWLLMTSIILFGGGFVLWLISISNLTLLSYLNSQKFYDVPITGLIGGTGGILLVAGILLTSPGPGSILQVWRKYPKVWRTAWRIPDRRNGEGLNPLMPILRFPNGQAWFIVGCVERFREKNDILSYTLLDSSGKISVDKAVWEQALLTYNFGNRVAQDQPKYLTDLNTFRDEIRSRLPRLIKVVSTHTHRQDGPNDLLDAVNQSLKLINGAYQEREIFLKACLAYYAAANFGTEFYFEDASQHRRLLIAFAKRIDVGYFQPWQKYRTFLADWKLANPRAKLPNDLIACWEYTEIAYDGISSWASDPLERKMDTIRKNSEAKIQNLVSRGLIRIRTKSK